MCLNFCLTEVGFCFWAKNISSCWCTECCWYNIGCKRKVLNFYSLLLLSDGDSEKYWTVPGLQNLGNNCFLNVILQDAEEAFSHLLTSLREELSEHYVPDYSYLRDFTALPHYGIRIINSSNRQGEWQRWWCSFFWPFDGIVGSILICQSCSFQDE